jgi:predicted RNA-binding Zn ribbon-like protein
MVPTPEFTRQSPWLDLVNSQSWDGFGRLTDYLREPAWVRRFLTYWRVRPPNATTTAFAELSDYRTVLRGIAERVARTGSLSTRAFPVLNAALSAPAYQRVVRRGDALSLELAPVRADWGWIRSQLAASLVVSARDRPSRLKICPNPGCRWVFVDATKGNTRRWCNDTRCGNRDRVRRARARQTTR